ncbi:MAG: DMT family transporter [Anaerolineae bacterium]|jgi:drug/metabolite transporter (DMT)-like permease|nr:DMT family transporter [Anaerolineae bacterium]
MEQNSRRGYLVAILSALLLAWTGIFIRYVSVNFHLPALILAFWRDLLVVVSLLPVLLVINPGLVRLEQKHFPFLIVFSLMLVLFNSFWTTAVAMTGAAVATVLVYSSGAFTAILDALIYHERIDLYKGIAIILCLAGCILVSEALDAEAWMTNALGIAAVLLSGLMYAVYTIFGRSAAQRGINTWTTILYTFLFAAIIFLVLNVLPLNFIPGTAADPMDMFWLKDSWQGWLALLLLAAGPTLLGYGTYNLALRDLSSSVVNLVVTSEPVFTMLIAFLLLGERMKLSQVVGSVLIMGGVFLMRLNLNAFAHNRKNAITEV